MAKRCKHRSGWYVEKAQLMADDDGSLTILPMPGGRRDKAVAICNAGCGATRNVYLDSVEIRFGKIRRSTEAVE